MPANPDASSRPRRRRSSFRRLQTRSNFEETSKQTESLMKKMMELRQMVSARDFASTCV